jgi:transposase-like protein
MSDLIRVQCPKCGGTMKAKAKKIRGGASMPCTHCATNIVFETESREESIRQALSQARRLRRQALALH